MTKLYNHAFNISFQLESAKEDASDVTNEDLLNALLKRIADCSTGRDADLVECCGCPYDTYETDLKESLRSSSFNAKIELRNRFSLENKDVGIE